MKKWKSWMGCLCAGVLAVSAVLPEMSIRVLAAEAQESVREERAADEKELVIDDSSFDLDDVLAASLGEAATVKVAVSMTGVGQTVLSRQVKLLIGWQKGFMGWSEDEEKIRTLGNNIQGASFTFEEGSSTQIRSIEFKMPEKSIVIPQGVSVAFENCSFNSTIVNNGTAVFHDCTFENGKIENNGTATYEGSTQEPENIAQPEEPQPAGGELVITDSNPYDLADVLKSDLGQKDTIKIAYHMAGVGQTVLPSQVKVLMGWQVKSFFDEEGEKIRSLGNEIEGDTFTFSPGSQITVKSIDFEMTDKAVVIPEGASVTFENCTFKNTIINSGAAVFNHCTFENGKIENNGMAEYVNGTQEPENLGQQGDQHIPLGLVVHETNLEDAVNGSAYEKEISYELSGTNKDQAEVTAVVSPENSGIRAQVTENVIRLSGTPASVGKVQITVTAAAPKEQVAIQEITLTVNEKLALSLEGTLDCVTAGQTQYQDYLTVYVSGENGEKTDYYDYRTENPDAELEVTLSPEGSGLRAYYLYDQIVVAGDARKAGIYQVSAMLRDKGQKVKSNDVELRVYTGGETLKEQFAALDAGIEVWDVEPYEIQTSDHAIVPVSLKTVYGSRESGLYAIIGNNQAVGSDTLVIPSGCDVTFENVKFYSSIKIIVEEGGSLTLSDSVAYGAVIVNGGTFSMKNSAALTDTLTLNDGSVLKDAQVESNGRFLTDGSDKKDAATVVTVNGQVTAMGMNTIQGDCGSGDLAGQTALQVNGELIVPAGSVLHVLGGGDRNYAPGWYGGTAVYLNQGTILGEGKLIAEGGVGVDGPGGNGIEGSGKISTAELESKGGDSISVVAGKDKGGNAVGEQVIVTTADPILTGGSGDPNGSASITLRADKSQLSQLMEQAGKLAEKDYTPESWKAFGNAMEEAAKILEDATAVQRQVDAALEALNQAMDHLEKAEVPETPESPEMPETPQNSGSQPVKPNVQVDYSNQGEITNKDVTVTLKADTSCKTPAGWISTGDGSNEFYKIYQKNAVETVRIESQSGIMVSIQVRVTGIDKKAPKIKKVSYSPSKNKVSKKKKITITVSEAIRKPGAGWKKVKGSGKTRWSKVYKSNQRVKLRVTDLAGNKSKAFKYAVKKVKNNLVTATVSYLPKETSSNQTVTVTLKTNRKCKTPKGWRAVKGSKKEFQKVYSKSVSEKVVLQGLNGKKGVASVKVTGLKQNK